MTRQINIREETYDNLDKLKVVLKLPRARGAKKGASFNAVIEELLSAYWNPVIRDFWLHEEFSTLQARLRVRGLSSDEVTASLERIKAKILNFGKESL